MVYEDKYSTKITGNEEEVELNRKIKIINNNSKSSIRINICYNNTYDYLSLKKKIIK